MIAKNKGDFLYQLHHELHRIGIDNDEEIFADFEEHFKESQEAGMSEEETCEKLGDVKEIARNYLDIPSTRLNSIVADAVANQRVSLTKPGEKLPADLSLVEQEKADPTPEQPAIREYTPEHIAQEPETPQSAVPKIDLNKETVREFTPEHIATEPEAPGAPREFTPNHIAPEQPAPDSGSRDTRYQYRTGSAPKQNSSEAFSSVHRCEMPQQNDIPKAGKYADKGGFKFTDIKGLKPNVNVGRLIGCIMLDLFLWSWLIPMVVSIIFGVCVSGSVGLVVGGFAQLGNGYFHVISRILLCCGMASAGVIVACIGFGLCKAVFHWIKSIVISHIKAVYDL